MIKKLDRSAGRVLGYEVEGAINIKQMRELEPEIEAKIEQYGHVNFLVILREFSGYGPQEMLGDIRFALKHWSQIGRIAVVGDKKWEEIAVKVDNFFAKWEEKFFQISELEQAWSWVEGQ